MTVPGVLIWSVKSFSPDVRAVTRILKLDVPAVFGVPLITPCVDSDNPAGSVPDTSVQVRGPVPPLEASVKE